MLFHGARYAKVCFSLQTSVYMGVCMEREELFFRNAPAEGMKVPLTICKKRSRPSRECFQFLAEHAEERVRSRRGVNKSACYKINTRFSRERIYVVTRERWMARTKYIDGIFREGFLCTLDVTFISDRGLATSFRRRIELASIYELAKFSLVNVDSRS